MSTDTGFAAISYPPLADRRRDDREERARIAGHAAGYAAGLRAAEAEVAARAAAVAAESEAAALLARDSVARAVAVLAAAASALDSRTVPLLESANAALAGAALDLAEAVVGAELSGGGVAAASAVHRALAGVEPETVHVVRLSPGDLAALEPALTESTGVRFAADPLLSSGDAVTEFADGFLDARISTALARARAAVAGVQR